MSLSIWSSKYLLGSILFFRQIAGAIKNLLDCIHSILNALPQGVIRQDLDGHMINFVDYSKRFSSALKGFFHDHK